MLAIVREAVEQDEAGAGQTVEVVFDRTPFYAESGGQASDKGTLAWPGGEGQLVTLGKHAGDLFVHTVHVSAGRLALGDRVQLELDHEARVRTRANHSAAHLVHAALKNVLGRHVSQKGQLVDSERMRFDFSHGQAMTAAEIDAVEAQVNAVIRQNLPATTRNMTPEAAIAEGAMALFGEKYGDEVRVLTLGRALQGPGDFSVELCGGTHVARTGDIALFRILSESGVAAGIRRVEAVTGEVARRLLVEQAGVAKGLAEGFKVPVEEVSARVEGLIAERKRLERELADARRKIALGGSGGVAPAGPETVNGLAFLGRVLDGVDGKGLRPVMEDMRKQVASGVVAIVGVAEGKAAVAVAVSADLQGRFSAADLVKAAVTAMGGQGGGGAPRLRAGRRPLGRQRAGRDRGGEGGASGRLSGRGRSAQAAPYACSSAWAARSTASARRALAIIGAAVIEAGLRQAWRAARAERAEQADRDQAKSSHSNASRQPNDKGAAAPRHAPDMPAFRPVVLPSRASLERRRGRTICFFAAHAVERLRGSFERRPYGFDKARRCHACRP